MCCCCNQPPSKGPLAVAVIYIFINITYFPTHCIDLHWAPLCVCERERETKSKGDPEVFAIPLDP